MKLPFLNKRIRLSNAELLKRLGRGRLDAFSLARFGAVMISNDVFSGRLVTDTAFREEPDMKAPFSGWTFFSSEEPADNLELHECIAILRVAPEVAEYLHLPAGTNLFRAAETAFDIEKDEA
jgi:hypothetical protein